MNKASFKTIAYQKIKENTFSGIFERGRIYSAQYFADVLKMSRTPVREALLQLANERFLTILPNRGIIIREIDRQLLTELAQVRCMVDGYCASELAEYSSSMNALITISALRDIIGKEALLLESPGRAGRAGAARTGAEQLIALDAEFHRTLINFVGNDYILDSTADIYEYLKFIDREYCHFSSSPDNTEDHKAIINAIISGDTRSSYDAAARHAQKPFLMTADLLEQA